MQIFQVTFLSFERFDNLKILDWHISDPRFEFVLLSVLTSKTFENSEFTQNFFEFST